MISVLLAEDHEIVREGFRAILERDPDLRVVAETGDGLEIVSLIESKAPDVLVVDLQLPGLHGLEVIRRVHAEYPWIGIAVLSMYDESHYVREALRRGAGAYILKDSSVDLLNEAIRAVLTGTHYLDPALPAHLLDEALSEEPPGEDHLDPYSFLSNREREVLQLTAEGLTMKEAAQRLRISPRTVEKHRESLMRKLGIQNRADLVRFAVYRGLLGPPPQS